MKWRIGDIGETSLISIAEGRLTLEKGNKIYCHPEQGRDISRWAIGLEIVWGSQTGSLEGEGRDFRVSAIYGNY